MTAVRGLVLLYTGGRSLSVSNPDVIATMKVFEGGRHDVFWLVVAIAAVCLGLGVFGLFSAYRRGGGVTPAQIGLIAGGVAMAALS